MKKRIPIILMLTGALLLSIVLPAAGAIPDEYLLLDSVNIGDTTSEGAHSLLGWSNIWSGCGWCGPDGNMRLIWGDGGETCAIENNWASVVLDAGTRRATYLKLQHLDGAADDGFNVYVNDMEVGTYIATSIDEWVTTTVFDIPPENSSGLLTIKLEATAPAWGSCGTYGQIAFNMIELYGPLAIDIDIKPDCDPNYINLGANGVIPVAIFGSEYLDVYDIVLDGVTLAGAEVRVKGKSGNIGGYNDLDGDGLMDVVIQVYNDMTDAVGGTTPAILTGYLTDGTPIEGSDLIVVVLGE